MSRKNSWFNDPALQLVRPGEFLRPDGSITPHDFGSILSAGASILGGAIQADAAEDASSAQAQGTAAATAEQRRQYDLNRSDLQPWRSTGSQAITRIGQLLGLGPKPVEGQYDAQAMLERVRPYYKGSTPLNDFAAGLTGGDQYGALIEKLRPELIGAAQEPGFLDGYGPASAGDVSNYGALNKKFTLADFWDDPVTKASFEFGLNEGTKALDRMAGAKGNRNSGAQLKALTRYGTDYTGTKAGESYNRFYGDQDRTFNRLSGVAGTGQTAATNTASMGTSMANNVSSLLDAGGNARGAAAIAGANARAGALTSAGNTIGNWWNNRNNPYGTPPFNPNGPYYSGYGAAGDYQYG